MILFNKISVNHHNLQHPGQELAAGPCHVKLVNVAHHHLHPPHQDAGVFVKCCVDK